MGVSSELVSGRKVDVHTSQTASKKAKDVEYSLYLVSVGAGGGREELATLFRYIDFAFLCDGTHLGGAAVGVLFREGLVVEVKCSVK